MQGAQTGLSPVHFSFLILQLVHAEPRGRELLGARRECDDIVAVTGASAEVDLVSLS